MWLWTGVAYHWLFLAPLNEAAYLFGLLFIIEGSGLAYVAIARCEIRFSLHAGLSTWAGAALAAYAFLLYPLSGILSGQVYPEMPTFGITPCPLTLFTVGLFLMTSHLPRWLLIIPFIWSLIGGSAAVLLEVPQDWALLIAGFVAVPIMLLRETSVASRGFRGNT
jgi:hypothetical protein